MVRKKKRKDSKRKHTLKKKEDPKNKKMWDQCYSGV